MDAPDTAEAGSAESKGADDQKPATESAVINKSVFPAVPEPGDVCKFKVLHVYEEEVELEYLKEGDKEKPKSSMSGAEDQIDAMAGKNDGQEMGA